MYRMFHLSIYLDEINLPFIQWWSDIDDVCLVVFVVENVISFELFYVRPSSHATFVLQHFELFETFRFFLTEFRIIRMVFRFQNEDECSQRSADDVKLR